MVESKKALTQFQGKAEEFYLPKPLIMMTCQYLSLYEITKLLQGCMHFRDSCKSYFKKLYLGLLESEFHL